MHSRFKSYSIDNNIAVISLVLVAVFLFSATSLVNMWENIDINSSSYARLAGEAVHSKTVAYLKPIATLNSVLGKSKSLEAEFFNNKPWLISLAKGILKSYPQIRTFIIGNEAGEFLMLREGSEDTFELREVHPGLTANMTVDYVLNEHLNIISFEKKGSEDFDPRARPWYIGAKTIDSSYWSDLYVFFKDKKPGFTVSHAYLDANMKFQGAFGFDIDLNKMCDFLKQLEIGSKGTALIVNKSGQVIASSETDFSLDYVQRTLVEDFTNISDYSFSKFINLTADVDLCNELSLNGEEYLGVVRSLKQDLGCDWKIIIIFPKDQLTKPYAKAGLMHLISLLATLILFFLLISYKVREVSATKQLTVQANTDSLTLLYNRNFFRTIYSSYLDRKGIAYSMILADIDYFKRINDHYGHSLGDVVLKNIASVMQSKLNEDQTIFRWGGEEFLIILEGKSLYDAARLAERIREDLDHRVFYIDNLKLHITMSFGVAATESNNDFKKTIQIADQNLYKAKTLGRNRVIGESRNDSR